ncbi:hypothetical protein ACFQ0D_24710, partial [Micromonospora zhanjiangensis]
MSYLDPHGSAEPRGWERGDPGGPRWPDEEDESRARHAGAAPETYADYSGYPSAPPFGEDDTAWAGGAPAYLRAEDDTSVVPRLDDDTSAIPRIDDGAAAYP